MKQRLSSGWSTTVAFGCLIWVLTLIGCGDGQPDPSAEPDVEPPPTQEYLDGEKAIQ